MDIVNCENCGNKISYFRVNGSYFCRSCGYNSKKEEQQDPNKEIDDLVKKEIDIKGDDN